MNAEERLKFVTNQLKYHEDEAVKHELQAQAYRLLKDELDRYAKWEKLLEAQAVEV